MAYPRAPKKINGKNKIKLDAGGLFKFLAGSIENRRDRNKKLRLIFLVEFILRDLSISREILAASTQGGLRMALTLRWQCFPVGWPITQLD
jgi:hypothetical protein